MTAAANRWSFAAASMFFALCAHCQETAVLVPVKSGGKVPAVLEAHVYGLASGRQWPVAILSHGSSGGRPRDSIDWSTDAAYFIRNGYVVIGYMRRGRGRSTGVSLESETKNCDIESWNPGIDSAIEDLDAIVEYAQTLNPAVAPHVLLVGMSRGGFLSIAYSAKGRHRNLVDAVVSFSAGWVAQAEDHCPTDFNQAAFERLGGQVSAPVLLLYGAGDLFYGDAAVRRYAAAFARSGGKGEFHLIPGVPENGHWLPAHGKLWWRVADAFLEQHRTTRHDSGGL